MEAERVRFGSLPAARPEATAATIIATLANGRE